MAQHLWQDWLHIRMCEVCTVRRIENQGDLPGSQSDLSRRSRRRWPACHAAQAECTVRGHQGSGGGMTHPSAGQSVRPPPLRSRSPILIRRRSPN
jgi:hypothetical protein